MRGFTFHCEACGRPLGRDRYEINPYTGRRTTAHAWCPDCYERILPRVVAEEVQETCAGHQTAYEFWMKEFLMKAGSSFLKTGRKGHDSDSNAHQRTTTES